MKLVAQTSLVAVVFSLSVFATSAMAEVTLHVDDNIKVTAINGQAYNISPFQKNQQTYTLQSGRHVITARYDRLYELSRDSHDYLKSDNITLAVDLADNQTYQLVMPNQPQSYEDARQYVKNPQLAVKQGNQILVSQSVSNKNSGLFDGLGSMIGGLFGRRSGVEANTQAIANMDTSIANDINASQANQANHTSVSTQQANVKPTSTLDQFMQLWLQATLDEREKIRQWVSQ